MEANKIRTWYVYKEVPKHEVSFIVLLYHTLSVCNAPVPPDVDMNARMVHAAYITSPHTALHAQRLRTVTKLTAEKYCNAPSRDLHVLPPPSKLSLHHGCLHRVLFARGVQKTGLLVPTTSPPLLFPGPCYSL